MACVMVWVKNIAPLARRAAETVVVAVDAEGLETLISELLRGLGDAQVSYECLLRPTQ